MKRIVSIIVSITLLTALLAGCGSSPKTEAAKTTQPAAEQKKEPAATASGNVKKKAEIHLVTGFPRFREQFEKYLNQFAQKYNYDLTIDLSMHNDQDASQVLKAKLASKQDVDIYTCHALNDLTTFRNAGYTVDLSSEPFVAQLSDSSKRLVTLDGKVLAVPLESLAWGMMYNKKIFREVGIKPALTVTELKENVKKLKEKKITPFLLTYKDSWIPQLFFAYLSGNLVKTKDKDFLNKMNAGTGSYAAFPEIFDIMDYVNANGTEKMFEIGGDDGCAEFANGKAAMWFMGPWFSESVLKANKDFEIGVCPLPATEDPKQATINVSGSTCLVMTPFTKNKEVAAQFLNYVLDEKDSSAFYQALQFNPVAKSHTFKLSPWIEEAMEYIKAGNSCEDVYIPPAVKDESGKLYQKYYSKKATREEVVKGLDKAWKDALANAAK